MSGDGSVRKRGKVKVIEVTLNIIDAMGIYNELLSAFPITAYKDMHMFCG